MYHHIKLSTKIQEFSSLAMNLTSYYLTGDLSIRYAVKTENALGFRKVLQYRIDCLVLN